MLDSVENLTVKLDFLFFTMEMLPMMKVWWNNYQKHLNVKKLKMYILLSSKTHSVNDVIVFPVKQLDHKLIFLFSTAIELQSMWVGWKSCWTLNLKNEWKYKNKGRFSPITNSINTIIVISVKKINSKNRFFIFANGDVKTVKGLLKLLQKTEMSLIKMFILLSPKTHSVNDVIVVFVKKTWSYI